MSDRKTIAVATAAFLAGVAASVVCAIVWKSIFAIAAPMAVGLAAAIVILQASE